MAEIGERRGVRGSRGLGRGEGLGAVEAWDNNQTKAARPHTAHELYKQPNLTDFLF